MEQSTRTRIKIFDQLTHEQGRYTIAGMLIFVAVIMSILRALATNDYDLAGIVDGFTTELIGAALTFVIFDWFIDRRDREKQEISRKKYLIRQLGSTIKDESIRAFEELEIEEWLYDGTLRDASLSNLNLNNMNLVAINLENAFLFSANFRESDFTAASLKGASLMRADLRDSNLYRTDLREAKLYEASLQGALIHMTDLRGTILSNASLKNAELIEIIFNEETTLPDVTKWTPDTDMERFTNPEHPDFWEPPAR